MNDQTPEHIPYNMAPSTVLTPPEWKHVSIHPDAGGRFKLAGYASAQPWMPGDLKALQVIVKGNKVWGLTKERALEIGLQIENGMRGQDGEPILPVPEGVAKPAPVEAAPPKKVAKPKRAEQTSFL